MESKANQYELKDLNVKYILKAYLISRIYSKIVVLNLL